MAKSASYCGSPSFHGAGYATGVEELSCLLLLPAVLIVGQGLPVDHAPVDSTLREID